MKHFLSLFEKVTSEQWNNAALTNFHADTFTHAEVAIEIAKMHLFFQKAGIAKGDKIAFAAKNTARWAIDFLATATYHAVAVPILADFTPENVQKLVEHSESKILFTDPKIFVGMQPEKIDGLKLVINIRTRAILYCCDKELQQAFEKLDELYDLSYPNGLQPSMVHYETGDDDEVVVINYTSGPTGMPKGVMIPARSISSNVNYGHENISNSPSDNALCMLPLAHMYGLTFEFLYTFLGGCHVYFLEKAPTPTVLMKAFAEVKPYILVTVPLVLEKIVKNKVIPVLEKPVMKFLTKLPVISNIIYRKIYHKLMTAFGGKLRGMPLGGAAISKPVDEILHKIGIPYTVGYGMTECGPLIGYCDWKEFIPTSCGKIVDNMEIRVDSDDPEHIVGELQVKGANVMLGYYKNPEATKAVFTEDGWLRTGDLGIIDANGNIFIKGRSKCMILSSNGQNIYPEEIESKLNDMPQVNESLIIERDKKLVAIVSLQETDDVTPDVQLDTLLEHVRQELNKSLPNYCKISKVEVVNGGDFVHTPKHSIKRCLYK